MKLFEKKNLSVYDHIIGYASYSKYLVRAFLRYRKTYCNCFGIIIAMLRKKYPVEASLRTCKHVTLHNHFEIFFISALQNHEEVEYNITNNILTISSLPYVSDNKMKEVKLYGGVNNGDVVATFLDNEYGTLPVKGRIVIDIGANIGDTPIYFALRGADKVIGLEPFPKNYEIAKKNIELNNLSNRIILLLAGCAATQGYITIDPDYLSSITSALVDFKKGVRVPLLTLDNILKEYNASSKDIILKMDCEGCEYEIILSANEDTLQKFYYIQIEYHSGYIQIKEKLQKSGFEVSFTRPMWNYRKQHIGYIYAKRKK
jgi:FkbM family methyltransferase